MKMDVKNMSDFESGSFDAVIDKGTLDSLMCGQNSQENATKMLEEVNRILKENGVYMLITYGDPSYRLRLLKDMEKWTVKLHVIERWEKSSNQNKWELTKPLPLEDHSTSLAALLGPKPDVHYIYVCVKGNGGASVDSKAGEAAN
ncbi:S-adenosyl-L-methionine-dependent methyltransferase superfamily protein [Zea mays]|nr:S-adenosyl-L-methionine-dependent methyltransferase superfamily protein [Zea mays]